MADDAPGGEPLWRVEYNLVIFAIFARVAEMRPKNRRLPETFLRNAFTYRSVNLGH